MIPTITYGDRLRRTRLAHGLNQAEFADQVRVDRALIARHELMDAPPQRNRRALAALIELRYGVPSDWLLYGVVPAQRDSHQYRAPSPRPALHAVQDDYRRAA